MEADILFLTYIIIFSFFLSTFPLSHSLSDQQYQNCNSPFNCGTLPTVGYPFWANEYRPPYCGSGSREFQLTCPEDKHDFASFQIGSQTFNVTGIDILAYKMTLVRTNFVYENCSLDLRDAPLSSYPFRYGPNAKKVTLLYDCPQNISIGGNNFTCYPPRHSDLNKLAFYSEEGDGLLQKFPDLVNKCEWIEAPVSKEAVVDPQGGFKSLKTALSKEFEVEYDVEESCAPCLETEGICGSDSESHFTCLCEDGRHAHDCADSSRKGHSITIKVIVGAIGGTTGALLICIILFWKISKPEFWKISKADQNIEAFIRNYGPLALTRYKFADIKKMTKSFKVKLGEGGYGAVYKGKLLNGCPVAVKLLKSSKGKGEQFINEVASISRTSHVNVVTLLGFCLEGQKKALIYEFMPNGSLDKFIHSQINKTIPSLTWENLYQVAIGTARGLEYLHRGCNTRILHFDIKPHNILLDENFCPKISDFGLAKLCPRKESIISISEARGTIGYLAPEIWNRNIGGVSHKSDVYSYGMMLLDMVGGRKNMNAEANRTTENYFPNWIYDQLEQGSDLECDGVNIIEKHDIAKRMTIVGLWCIQTIPTQRPTMSRVIEMLEGSPNSLEMPPKPVMSSPSRFELESSTTNNTTT